jgi:hypothetical protein
MNQHRLVVSPEVIEWDYKSTVKKVSEEVNRFRLFYQMTRITRDRNSLVKDDRLDAVAGAVAYWIESMNRSREQAHLQSKEAALDAELEKFMDSVLGIRLKKTHRYRIPLKSIFSVPLWAHWGCSLWAPSMGSLSGLARVLLRRS